MKRHMIRLALVLALLGTAVFAGNDAWSGSLDGSCTVTRNCDYGPPYSISCTSANGTCQSGPDNYGWVECDYSGRQYCPDPCAQNGVCYGCATDPDCQCNYPNCEALDGTACLNGKKTLCVYSTTTCRTLTCNCYEGRWVCP